MMDQLIERIRRHIEEVGDCWEWQGAMQSAAPVPVMNYKQSVMPVRRLIAIERGVIVKGKFATYRCGNQLCVNPDHVIVVTRQKLQKRIAAETKYQINPVRMQKLATFARARGKLTLELAQAIRDAEGSQRDIAKRFGVTQATVSVIKRGKTWRDYTNPFTQLIGGLNK